MNLSLWQLKKVFNIKVQGYLKNFNDNLIEYFEANCVVKEKKYYTYINNETTYTLEINNKEIIMIRENSEIKHTIFFSENKTKKSIYYLKDLKQILEFKIKTTKLEITKEKITIIYEIIETDNKYEYKIEMSDKKWV